MANKRFYLLTISLSLSLSLVYEALYAIPINNIYEVQSLYTVRGIDKYYHKVGPCAKIWANISPYYQHTKSARDDCGKKVPAGDIYGKWNMFGLFYGREGVPTGKTFASFARLEESRTKVSGLHNGSTTIFGLPVTGGRYAGTAESPIVDFTDETKHDADLHSVGYYSQIPIKHERYGLRGEITALFSCGIGLSVRAGATYYRRDPVFTLSNSFRSEAGLSFTDDSGTFNPAVPPGDLSNRTDVELGAVVLYEHLLRNKTRNALGEELCQDFKHICQSHAEDIHANLFWQYGFDCCGEDNSLNCIIAPYLACGIWLPTGAEKDETKMFSIPTGNNGNAGFTLDAQINIIFPQMLHFGLGGGLLVSLEHSQMVMPIPTHPCQSGIFPWKAAARIRPGITWYVNASMKAEFLKYLHFYGDYIFTEHLKDDISLCEDDATRANAFKEGITRLERHSCWRNQQIHIGAEYEICPALSLGLGLQGHIRGVLTYHLTNVMGTVRFTF